MRVRLLLVASLFTMSALVSGCGQTMESVSAPTTPTPPVATDSCDAAKAAFAVGQPASDDLLERARAEAGARVARLLRPNQVITLEYSGWRLNLNLDVKDVVRSGTCG